MSQTPLKIVTFGADQETAHRVRDGLSERGIDAESYVGVNTTDGDAEITHILNSKKWDGFFVGFGIRKQPDWFKRIVEIAKNANPNLPLIDTNGPNDVANAIERYFKIELPSPAST